MKDLINSKKFKIVVLDVVTTALAFVGGNYLGLDEDQIEKLVAAIQVIFGLWIGGHAVTDAAHQLANRTSTSISAPPSDAPPSDG